MIRNLKAVGLVALAVLALGAVAFAASAQAANGRLTSTGNFTLTGTEIKPSKLTAFGLSVECEVFYVGHTVGSKTAFLPNGSENATLTPTFKQPCKNNFAASTIDLNGCDYVIHLGETFGEDKYSVTYDIVCPAGKDITATNWITNAEHTEGKEACTLHIAPQTGLKGGTVEDTTKGDLILRGPVGGIKVVETKDNLHSLLCPAKEGAGELDLEVTVQGDNEGGTNTAVSLSHL